MKMPPRKIAIVTCSTRKPRLNPYISKYVLRTVERHSAITSGACSVEVLDLADQSLPLYDESAIPATHPVEDPTPHYEHEHTRKWSSTIRNYDAFVFVTPQYNWSVPASLKNALDFLFHEWNAKPVGIVSYGGRGGGKSAAHLRDIVSGLRMAPVPTAATLVMKHMTPEVCERDGIPIPTLETWQESGEEEKVSQMFSEIISAVGAINTAALAKA